VRHQAFGVWPVPECGEARFGVRRAFRRVQWRRRHHDRAVWRTGRGVRRNLDWATVVDNCFVVDTPDQRFCKVTTPFRGQMQFKMNAIFPLPRDFTASAVFQHTPGIPITASYVATNAEIARTLGRNLAACGTQVTCTATATVELIEPN